METCERCEKILTILASAGIEPTDGKDKTVSAFLAARTLVDPTSNLTARKVYSTYVEFCGQNNLAPLGINAFGRLMHAKGYRGTRGTNGIRMRPGLRLIRAS